MKIPDPINNVSNYRDFKIQLRDEMLSNNINPPEYIVFDGSIHRFSTSDKNGDDAGWYIAWNDDFPCGKFGDFRRGIEITWFSNIGRELTLVERMQQGKRIAEAKEKHEKERIERNATAKEQVEYIWSRSQEASPDHPYLKTKGIQPNGARVGSDGRLLVPLYDKEGELSTLQYIGADGKKLYHPGGKTKESYHVLGTPEKKIYLCEGFATGATVYETMGECVYIAYSAHNIPDIAGVIREKHGLIQLIIVADNDKSGTGLNYATQATAKHGGQVITPPVEGMDANDYRASGGDLAGLLDPKVEEWLVSADEWSSENKHVSWMIKKWLQEESTMMVFGPSGVGKSFVVLDWCLRLSSELTDWQGFKVNQVPVVYLAGEGHNGLRGRIAAWKQYNKSNAGKMWLSKSGTDINLPGPLSEAVASISMLPESPGLIVIDTLHRFLAGDENSPIDVKSMLDSCSELRKHFKCSVMLVHHTGVAADAQGRARGSSAWKGAMDVEINVRPNGKTGLTVEQMKVKDGERQPPINFEIEGVKIDGWFDEDGEQVSSAVVVKGQDSQSKDNKLDGYIKMFKDAWYDSKCGDSDGDPYISSSAIREFLRVRHAKTPANIAKMMQKTGDRFIGYLIEKGVIEETLNGFRVVDESLIGIMNMSRL